MQQLKWFLLHIFLGVYLLEGSQLKLEPKITDH